MESHFAGLARQLSVNGGMNQIINQWLDDLVNAMAFLTPLPTPRRAESAAPAFLGELAFLVADHLKNVRSFAKREERFDF